MILIRDGLLISQECLLGRCEDCSIPEECTCPCHPDAKEVML